MVKVAKSFPPKHQPKGDIGRRADLIPQGDGTQILYPKRKMLNYTNTEDENCPPLGPLTVEECKRYMGWTEEPEPGAFGEDYLLTDRKGKRIRCKNNRHNRWITFSNLEQLIQTHLNGRWQENGETCVIGKYGSTLSVQHRFISAILAEQERTGDNRLKWEQKCPHPITLATYVIVGVEETDEVVNTLDTGRSRTLPEVLFRSEQMRDLPMKLRKKMAKVFGFAVQFVWYRTGAKENAFAPLPAHSERLQFAFETHPRILDCVRHICEIDKEGHISSLLGPGYSAGLCYLMGACESDGDQYAVALKQNTATEQYLDMSMMDRAFDFWQLLADSGKPDIDRDETLWVVREAIALTADTKTQQLGHWQERVAILVRAWNVFKEGHQVVDDDLVLDYAYNEDLKREVLAEAPIVEGIDIGDPSLMKKIRELGVAATANQDDEPPQEDDLDELRRRELEAAFSRQQRNGLSDEEQEEPEDD